MRLELTGSGGKKAMPKGPSMSGPERNPGRSNPVYLDDSRYWMVRTTTTAQLYAAKRNSMERIP